jgi:hypothetical protein
MTNPPQPSLQPCYPCPHCRRLLKSSRGLTQHCNSAHRQSTPPLDPDEPEDESEQYKYRTHTYLNGKHCLIIIVLKLRDKYSGSLRQKWQEPA